MATLNIRNLPDEVHRRLRVRAAEHGRSMEAEARAILTDACTAKERPPMSRKQLLREAKELQAFNLAEVLLRLARNDRPVDQLPARLERFQIEWVPFERGNAFQVAALGSSTQGAGLSLGDRVCLGLAIDRGLPVLTADRAWASLRLGVSVRLIR